MKYCYIFSFTIFILFHGLTEGITISKCDLHKQNSLLFHEKSKTFYSIFQRNNLSKYKSVSKKNIKYVNKWIKTHPESLIMPITIEKDTSSLFNWANNAHALIISPEGDTLNIKLVQIGMYPKELMYPDLRKQCLLSSEAQLQYIDQLQDAENQAKGHKIGIWKK